MLVCSSGVKWRQSNPAGKELKLLWEAATRQKNFLFGFTSVRRNCVYLVEKSPCYCCNCWRQTTSIFSHNHTLKILHFRKKSQIIITSPECQYSITTARITYLLVKCTGRQQPPPGTLGFQKVQRTSRKTPHLDLQPDKWRETQWRQEQMSRK